MAEQLTVTAIEPQKRRKNHFSVFINGRFWIGMDAETLAISGLTVGATFTPDQLDELQRTVIGQSARNVALRMLARAQKSRGQIQERLEAYGYAPEVIEETLAFLERYGLVNDAELARTRARSAALASRPKGPQYVRERLRRTKVAETDVEAAILETYADVDLVENAVRFLGKKAGRLIGDVDERKLQKLAASYQKKGYSPDAAQMAARRELLRRQSQSLAHAAIRGGYPPDVAWEAVRRIMGGAEEEWTEA